MKSHSKSKTTIQKHEQAQVRRAARNSRSDKQQLALLIERGAGDCDEADKLRGLIGGALLDKDDEELLARKKPRLRHVPKRRKLPASLM